MVDKRYVRYKDRCKVKDPHKADHLRPYQWKPGETGNKEGRPCGVISITENLKAYLRRHPKELEEIVISLVKEGRLGNMVATKEILDRVDGKVVEVRRIEGELPVKITFVPAPQALPQDKIDKLNEAYDIWEEEEQIRDSREVKELGNGDN